MWNSPGCIPGRGPCLQGAGQAPAGAAPPLAGRAPLQAAGPSPAAPSETNAAHGGLYGARRQRVARLTLRGKFGGGRQGALMRGPPAAAAARGGGGCRKREPGSRASTPAHSQPLPRTTRQVEAPCSSALLFSTPVVTPFQEPCFSCLHFLLCKMGPTFFEWAGGLNELLCCTGGQHVGSRGQSVTTS